MTYFEMVKKDIENAIVDGYYNEVILNKEWDKVKIYRELLTQMWNDDCITGNSWGGYYFQIENTIKMIQENMEEVKTAYNFFDYDLVGDLLEHKYAEIDSRTRCYFLNIVLYEVLKETKVI